MVTVLELLTIAIAETTIFGNSVRMQSETQLSVKVIEFANSESKKTRSRLNLSRLTIWAMQTEVVMAALEKIEHPNGYYAIRYGTGSMIIYNPGGKEVIHTAYHNAETTAEEMMLVLEDMPNFLASMNGWRD